MTNAVTISHTFNIGDRVFHSTRDGDEGIIINMTYDFRLNCVKYEVVFGRQSGDDVWCFEEELSESKIF